MIYDTPDHNRELPDRSRGHETRDIRFRPFVMIGVGIIVAGVVGHLLLWTLFNVVMRAEERQDPAPPPLARATQIPPAPRLQVSPPRDWAEMYNSHTQRLNSYGWADQQRRTVHIPIGRAMELIEQRGLPVRPDAQEFREAERLQGPHDLDSEGGQLPGVRETITPRTP